MLVAEAPPDSLDRYFYFTDVREHDHLFRYVCRVVLEQEPTRNGKAELLAELRSRAVFLIDLSPDPLDDRALDEYVSGLIRRCRQLDPRCIVLIKTTVYDAAFGRLRDAGLPVVDERIPFPASGRQKEFVRAFGRALRQCG